MKAIGNYLIEKESLGKGQFGQVFKCHLKADPKKHFAVKVIQKKILTPRLFNNLRNEINILTKINSPYVIKLHDLQRTENNFYLIMELCNAGDLENLKEIRGRFTEVEARMMIQQIVAGFEKIYEQQVMHRDLKLANILVHFIDYDFGVSEISNPVDKALIMNDKLSKMDLVKSNIQVKIADLGFARELSSEDLAETVCGTPLVMAPEVLNGKRYNHKADVWSLGIIFFEMITGFTPFTGRDKNDLKRNLEKGVYKLPKKLKLSLHGLDFLNCCLQFDMHKRMSWSELVKHPYITKDPRGEPEEEQMHLSYSHAHGQYIRDNLVENIDDSSILMRNNPYTYMNEKNAIMLNCKDQQLFQDVYERTVERHFKKQISNPQPVLKLNTQCKQVKSSLAESMGYMKFEMPEDDDDDYEDLEEKKEELKKESGVSGHQFEFNTNMMPDNIMTLIDIDLIDKRMKEMMMRDSAQKQQAKHIVEDTPLYIIDEKIRVKPIAASKAQVREEDAKDDDHPTAGDDMEDLADDSVYQKRHTVDKSLAPHQVQINDSQYKNGRVHLKMKDNHFD